MKGIKIAPGIQCCSALAERGAWAAARWAAKDLHSPHRLGSAHTPVCLDADFAL